MKKTLTIFSSDDGYENACQTLKDGEKTLFNVYNLSDCPEDAIIGRGLLSASDIVEYIEMGMKFAREGITELEIIKKKEETDE